MNTPDLRPQGPEHHTTETGTNTTESLLDRSEDYNDAVIGMLGQLSHKAKRVGYDEAINQLWDAYVVDQADEDPDLAEFCGVMLRGPQDKAYNDRLQTYQDRKRVGNTLNGQEREDEYAMKYAQVESNHAMRDMIARQPGAFKRQQLKHWYTSFTQDAKYAEGAVDGSYAEIAVFEAANHSQETLRNVRYGTVEDDLRGGDIMATYVRTTEQGTEYIPVSLDAKAGKQTPVGTSQRDSLHVVVGIPTHMFDAHGHIGSDDSNGVGKLIGIGLRQAEMAATSVRRAS